MICGIDGERNVTLAHVREHYAARYNGSLPEFTVEETVAQIRETHPREPVTEEGYYFDGQAYWKAQRSETSGHLYAKNWNGNRWVYQVGGLKGLYADMAVSTTDAKRFGDLFGVCVFCSRKLTDERSISKGYGPVCAEHNGLPWGDD